MISVAVNKKVFKRKRFKLVPGSKLTEDQIVVFVKHYNKHKSFPGSKILCNVTGKLTTAVGPWLRKKVNKVGSAEKLLRSYVCKQATKKQKITPISKKRRKLVNDEPNALVKENGRYDIPLININNLSRPMTESELAKDSQNMCLRPDIFLHNGRHCEGCKYYKICENGLKTLPKHISFDGIKFVSNEIPKTKKNNL